MENKPLNEEDLIKYISKFANGILILVAYENAMNNLNEMCDSISELHDKCKWCRFHMIGDCSGAIYNNPEVCFEPIENEI